MTDIAKCGGDGCDMRNTCRRYTAPRATREMWAAFDATPKPCAYYYHDTSATAAAALDRGEG